MKKTIFRCTFCLTPTGFKDGDKAFCIDCYVKLRNSAHTHDGKDTLPIRPMPLPSINPHPFFTETHPQTWTTYTTPTKTTSTIIC